MIVADFFSDRDNKLTGFCVTGHAGLADYGEDVCCASVSSAVMMAANTITEAFRLDAQVEVNENEIKLMLPSDPDGSGDKVLLGLMIHLNNMADEFVGHIKVRVG